MVEDSPPEDTAVSRSSILEFADDAPVVEPTPEEAKRRQIVSRLSTALAVLFILVTLVRTAPNVKDAYSLPTIAASDANFLYAAGKLSTSSEANILYGPRPANENQWNIDHGYNYPTYYPYAPLGAMSMGVLTRLTDIDGYLTVWRVLVALATIAFAIIVARVFKDWAWRAAIVVAIICWDPILLNASIGQTGIFVALMTAISVTVFLHNKPLGAILMGLMAIKPTAVIGPSLLVFPEKLPIWARFAGGAALVVLPPFLYIGPGQLTRWLDILSQRGVRDASAVEGTHYFNQGFNSALGLSFGLGVIVAIGLLVVAAMIVQSVQGRLGLYAGAAFALCIANVVNPHSLLYDWGTAFVVIMLLRQAVTMREEYRDVAIGALMITLFVAGQLAWNVRFHSYAVRPLTIWGLLVTMGLVVVAFWPQLQAFFESHGGAASAPAPVTAGGPRPGPRMPAPSPEDTRRMNRSRKRREQRAQERARKP